MSILISLVYNQNVNASSELRWSTPIEYFWYKNILIIYKSIYVRPTWLRRFTYVKSVDRNTVFSGNNTIFKITLQLGWLNHLHKQCSQVRLAIIYETVINTYSLIILWTKMNFKNEIISGQQQQSCFYGYYFHAFLLLYYLYWVVKCLFVCLLLAAYAVYLKRKIWLFSYLFFLAVCINKHFYVCCTQFITVSRRCSKIKNEINKFVHLSNILLKNKNYNSILTVIYFFFFQ